MPRDHINISAALIQSISGVPKDGTVDWTPSWSYATSQTRGAFFGTTIKHINYANQQSRLSYPFWLMQYKLRIICICNICIYLCIYVLTVYFPDVHYIFCIDSILNLPTRRIWFRSFKIPYVNESTHTTMRSSRCSHHISYNSHFIHQLQIKHCSSILVIQWSIVDI